MSNICTGQVLMTLLEVKALVSKEICLLRCLWLRAMLCVQPTGFSATITYLAFTWRWQLLQLELCSKVAVIRLHCGKGSKACIRKSKQLICKSKQAPNKDFDYLEQRKQSILSRSKNKTRTSALEPMRNLLPKQWKVCSSTINTISGQGRPQFQFTSA